MRDNSTGQTYPAQASDKGGLVFTGPGGVPTRFDPAKHTYAKPLTPLDLGYGYGAFNSITGGIGAQQNASTWAPPVGVAQMQTPGGPVTTNNTGAAAPAEWQAAMQDMQQSAPAAPSGVIMKGVPPQSQPEFQGRQAEEKAAGQVKGQAQAQAQVDLPGAELDLELTKDYINELRSHPGLDSATGWTGAVLPVLPAVLVQILRPEKNRSLADHSCKLTSS